MPHPPRPLLARGWDSSFSPEFLLPTRYTHLFPWHQNVPANFVSRSASCSSWASTAQLCRNGCASCLTASQPAGIILFKRNLEHAEQTHALLSGAQKTAETPMFLCVDMEGGTVDRLRDVIAPIPSGERGCGLAIEEALPPAWPPDRRRSPRPGLQHRLRAGLRSALRRRRRACSARAPSPTSQSDTIGLRKAFLRGLARLRCAGLRQAFPRPRRGATWTRTTSCPRSTRSGRRCGSRTWFHIASCMTSCRS